MPDQRERKLLDLSAIFDDLQPEAAGDIVRGLMDNDLQFWMTLAEDFPHPPSALLNLVKKAGMPFPQAALPTEQERILYAAGALPPSKRVVEIALFIANDPEALKQFEVMAKPIRASREKLAVEAIARGFGSHGKKIIES